MKNVKQIKNNIKMYFWRIANINYWVNGKIQMIKANKKKKIILKGGIKNGKILQGYWIL